MDFANEHLKERMRHWDGVAQKRRWRFDGGAFYRKRLIQIMGHLVPSGLRVLEIGCGEGDIIAHLKPSFGVGVDISHRRLAQAQRRYHDIRFVMCDGHQLAMHGQFDAIILSDVLNDVWDVQGLLDALKPVCTARTRLIINSSSKLWEVPLRLAVRIRLCTPLMRQNWLTVQDIRNLLHLADYEMVRAWEEVLFPFPLPLIEQFLNRMLVRFAPFHLLAITNFIIARPRTERSHSKSPSVSIVIPARNERGNIQRVFSEMPDFGAATELIFVEGNSTDGTYELIGDCIRNNPRFDARLVKQHGKGKGDAVRLGFSLARNEILMIFDADCTVAPDDLVRFYGAIASGKGEFINGVRLVYPMGKNAMQVSNLVANTIFGRIFSWLLGQPVKDTLCGTKALWRSDYELIAKNRSYFGEADPFGDFDLLFGAARLNLKIIDVPVRYGDRTYGTTNINRWRHGVLLMRMAFFALNKLKFV
jgi:ubiquinone/menaquinone biosynthesis C-methylase UbiE